MTRACLGATNEDTVYRSAKAVLLILAGALLAPLASSPAHAGSLTATTAYRVRGSLNGLLPIWDHTADVLEHGQVYLGVNEADFGVAGVAQVGVDPLRYALRVPNIHARLVLHRSPQLDVAAHAAFYAVLPGASESLFSSVYSSRVSNPVTSLYVVPISGVVSVWPLSWIQVNATATALTVGGAGHVRERVTPGIFASAALLGPGGHGLYFHAGEVGLWDHAFTTIGWSVRAAWSWGEIRGGYSWQLGRDGAQGRPLLDIGVSL